MISLKKFQTKFTFAPNDAGCIGVERESFLLRDGNIVPIAESVLNRLPDRQRYGYELSACQLEDRVGPIRLPFLKEALSENDKEISAIETSLGFQRSQYEVAPPDMPLNVYPDPTGRYQRITKNMPVDILAAACRVIGTHIHIGMPDPETALSVYNGVISHAEELCALGDGSNGERLTIYRKMAPDWQPNPYQDWHQFYRYATEKKFVSDPRKCWTVIRISKHGTIEFRMFGTTCDLSKIVGWAETCLNLCERACPDFAGTASRIATLSD